MELSRFLWDLGGKGGGGWQGGTWLGDGGGGIAAPGLPPDDGIPVKAPITPIVPELKPKWLFCDWWCGIGKWPGDPSCGLLPGELIESPDMLRGPGEPGGWAVPVLTVKYIYYLSKHTMQQNKNDSCFCRMNKNCKKRLISTC